jgi:hypothetical protein
MTDKEAFEKDQRDLSEQLFEYLADSHDGFQKEASEGGTAVLRRRIREAGIARQIITPKPAQDSQLTRFPNHENPVIVRELEPDSKGAVSVPFGAGYDTEFFFSEAYICEFHRIQTPEFIKDINHLRPLKYDLVKWIQDNMLKDIQRTEDFRAWALFDTIVGDLEGTGAANYVQNHRVIGSINRQTYPLTQSYLEDNELNNGVYVMNRKTAKAFLTNFDADDYGDELAGETFRNGMGALKKNINGIPHVFTIKRGLIPDNVIYIFAEENFLGNFDVLEDVKLYIKKEKDILHMSASETIALTIGNVAGIHRVEFTG